MAPKKQKTSRGLNTISNYFGKENTPTRTPLKENGGNSTPTRTPLKENGGNSTPTWTPLKENGGNSTPTKTPLTENGGDSGEHSHHFAVQLSSTDFRKFTCHCVTPCTLLEAVKSIPNIPEDIKNYVDENIIFQIGKEDGKCIVASHFPCCCVGDDEIVILHRCKRAVEKVQTEHKTTLPKDRYGLFYIDTKSKNKLFRNARVKEFKFLCVYAEKGTTMKEALKKDGRFIDDLGDFSVTNNESPDYIIDCTRTVGDIHQKKFKITLPLKKRDKSVKPKESILDMAIVKGISVNRATEFGISAEKFYELVREQFPELKEWMESQFPGDSFQKELNLKKENFGKIQQSFKEVYRVRKLLKMSMSICKIVVTTCTGTGFVLFDRYILTSAHLFQGCVEGKRLHEVVEVSALFNYEEPEPVTKYFCFPAEKTLIDIDMELDYAILELKSEGQKAGRRAKSKNIKVPPGLLSNIGPLPENGEACIIGHPGGGVKQTDYTWIIEAEKREQSINDYLGPYQNTSLFLLITQAIKNQGIEDIMMGGKMADKVGTYNTFMYHGSSGSPVFDAHGRVFGLHTAGYTFEFQRHKGNVIEYAHPLLTIFEKWVGKLEASGDRKMLARIEEVAKENLYIKKILHPEPADPEESMELN